MKKSNSNKRMLGTLTGSILLLSTAQINAEVSANVSMVSDYVFRGISQSQEDPAIQGGFDWAHESGFYLGTWASTVDFVAAGPDDGADVEWDVYLGYGGNINESWTYDVSYIQYLYPGTVSGVDYDYGEVVLGLGYNDFLGFTVGYSNDVFNSDETGIYYEVSVGNDFGDSGFSWNAAVGHYDLDDLDSSYTHYSAGITKSFEKVSLGLSFHDSNGEEEFGDIAEARAVFSISAEF